MSFKKRGLPLIDMKMPAASNPIVSTHFRAALSVPLSLFETVAATSSVEETVVEKGENLYIDENGLPTVAPACGTVSGCEEMAHPLYGRLTCVTIRPEEGEERLLTPLADPLNASPADIAEIARLAGIIDETDGVPLFEKLHRYADNGCQVVANAVEAQPYASAAFAVLCERQEAVLGGLKLAVRAVAGIGGNVAVCLNNADMRRQLKRMYSDKTIYFAPERYPVDVYTAVEAPTCLIGVQALCALYDAAYTGTAATTTVITVAGDMVKTPQNLRVAFGTPIQSLLDSCGLDGTPAAIIGGDVFTGTLLPDATCPVLPGMTCLTVLSAVPAIENEPCIGCGRCAEVCHKRLLPYEIVRRLENMHYERLAHLDAEACDGCAACSVVCPAKRDVVNGVLYAAQSDGSVFLDWGGNDHV